MRTTAASIVLIASLCLVAGCSGKRSPNRPDATRNVPVITSGTIGAFSVDTVLYAPPQEPGLPIQDQRDNAHGGFAFSTYHPGTSLPQMPWAR